MAFITFETITEVAVEFFGTPEASGAKDSIIFTGKTDVSGYVVCWMSRLGKEKAPEAAVSDVKKRILEDTDDKDSDDKGDDGVPDDKDDKDDKDVKDDDKVKEI